MTDTGSPEAHLMLLLVNKTAHTLGDLHFNVLNDGFFRCVTERVGQ
jgi:hypothetical protein